ncbi:MAG: SusC/RagA family TonB-linked outer membrane protein [Gemmatimonadetes bacterium]|nr:SusC/RagA family TonB-linked outer membrane protein [Gemmatimonadota bacterium]
MTSSGQPLGGASVGIPELGVGAITGSDGKYSFTVEVAKARGNPVALTVRYIGYKPKRMSVILTAGRTEKDYDLEKDVLSLDQVVVTGVNEATSQKKTAFSVGVVDASQIKESPATSPIGALAGKVAGAEVMTTSGQPGAEPAIRLRSATSLTGRQDPLIIVDGTITRLGLADINSEDIERVEVIKGAAASSLYGSDAANGVVQIFTKRGASLAEGQLAFTIRNELGSSNLPRKVPGNMSHDYQQNADGSFLLDANGNRQERTDKLSVGTYPKVYDQLDQVFKPGQFMTNYVSVGQRRGSNNFNASFQNTHDAGTLALLNGFSRQNFRINVDQVMNDQWDISTGAFYGRSHSDQGTDHGIFFGLKFLEPNIDITAPNKDGTPYNAVIKQPPLSGNVVNPLYGLAQRSVYDDRDRFTGTFKLRYRPTSWLTAEGNVNFDESNEMYKNFTPKGFLNSSGAASNGGLFEASTADRSYNTGVTVTATKTWGWLTNTTKGAWVYEDQLNRNVNVNATSLSVPQVTEFAAAAQDPNNPVQPGSSTQTIRNQDFFLISTFDIKDKLIVDGLVRRDESSLFGAQSRSATYHRISAAYRLSEDIHIPGVDEFKLRYSYGTAGLRPVFDAQYQIFSVSGGSPQKVTLGNPLLKPAFSREGEYGFNINFLTNFTLEYSYSDKVTSDQILKVPVSSASGYQNQWVNAATLAGNTHELTLGAVLYSKGETFWRMNLAGDRTRQTITAMNVAPELVGPDPNDGNTRIFRIAAGQKFGVIYGSQWIRTADQLATTIKAGGLSGAASDYQLNEQGYYVAKSAFHTINEAPLKAYNADGTTLTAIGDVNPDFNLSMNQTFQYKSLSINGVFTWTKGGNIYNYTRQWPFNEQRDPVFDQRGLGAVPTGNPYSTGMKPVTYYQTFYNNFDPNSYFVEDGSFIRLRELSVNYQLPKSWVKALKLGDFQTAKLGIVGRNLWTSTKYSGYDPDVTGPGGGNPFAYRVDYFTYPAYRTFTMMLELGY